MAMASRMPMMMITTRSSMSVNPLSVLLVVIRFLSLWMNKFPPCAVGH